MNKILLGLAILLIAGIAFAVQAGVTFTPQQIANADIENYDFELTNEGWTINDNSFDFNFGYITGEKVYDINGVWTGEVLTVQKYKTEQYWKERYVDCREGISPYVYEIDIGQINDLNEPIFESIVDSSKEGCIKQAKENIKERVINFREKQRKELLKLQAEVQNYLDSYDGEWTNVSGFTNEELN